MSEMGHGKRTFWCKLAAAALISVAGTMAAAADGLFASLPSHDASLSAAKAAPDFAVLRSRDVALDASYLTAKIAPLGVDQAADRLADAPAASTVRIELFPGSVVDLQRKTISEAFGGGFVWTGEAANRIGADGNLVIRDGRITGIVTSDAKTYRIDPLGQGNAHRISEMDGSAFPGDITLPVPSSERLMPKADLSPTAATTDITVLVAYTAAAQASVPDIVAQANLAVSRANSAYASTNIPISLRLVGTTLVSGYDETAATDYNAVLNDLTSGTASGPFQPVHALRDALGADLVSLLHDRIEYCGLAWMIANPSTATASYGMSAVTTNCISNESFAHELGHNMGLNHDRYAESAQNVSASVYSYGFVVVPGQFRDIMAYNNECAARQPPVTCARKNFFSSPGFNFNGYPIGIPQGTAGAADASRRLGETRAGIASYRVDTPPPTASILAAVTPVARATSVGGTVTAFATILNTGGTTATSCGISVPSGYPVTFGYAARDASTGAPENLNTPVDIAAGGGRNFVMSFVPNAELVANIPLVFSCANAPAAPSVLGLNTFLLTGTTGGAPADLVSIAVTATGDGIANVPLGGTGFAALAAVNIGTGANLQAQLSQTAIGGSGSALPATLTMCQTNSSGTCFAAPSPTVDFTAAANETVTFSAFAASNGTPIPFDPANTRLFVHFYQGNTPVGSASVAVRTTSPDAKLAAAN